jgi:hypothetical protein
MIPEKVAEIPEYTRRSMENPKKNSHGLEEIRTPDLRRVKATS